MAWRGLLVLYLRNLPFYQVQEHVDLHYQRTQLFGITFLGYLIPQIA